MYQKEDIARFILWFMVAHSILAVLAVVALATGAVSATALSSSGSNSAIFDLGTLHPGMTGNANITETVSTGNFTSYKVEMETEDGIAHTFSELNVSMTIDGNHYPIGHSDLKVNLSKGTHTITVIIHYVVSDHATNTSMADKGFLFLHPAGDQNMSDVKENNSQQDHSSKITIAALTFQVTGQNGHQDGEQASSKDNTVLSVQ